MQPHHQSDRREIVALAVAPVLPSLAYSLTVAPWRIEAIAAMFLFVCGFAYLTYFLAGMPLLLLFKRLGWQQWYHFALAGFVSVFVVWVLPTLWSPGPWNVLNYDGHRVVADGKFTQFGRFWMLVYQSPPALLAAAGGVFVWWLGFRRKNGA